MSTLSHCQLAVYTVHLGYQHKFVTHIGELQMIICKTQSKSCVFGITFTVRNSLARFESCVTRGITP